MLHLVLWDMEMITDASYSKIRLFFEQYACKSFGEKKIREILRTNYSCWSLPVNCSVEKLLADLIKKKLVYKHDVLSNQNELSSLFSWGTQDPYTVFSGIKPNAYYGYYSAMFLHGLTLQIPKTYYLNNERSQGKLPIVKPNVLSQKSIDNAFKKTQRKSLSNFSFLDKTIVVTNGKYTDRLGVVRMLTEDKGYYYTDIERTLIDITVRPVYSGGVFEVMESYRRAKGKVVIGRLKEYLEKLDYIYPYNQLVGFYLEKAGYEEGEINLFNTDKAFDFYLTYNIRRKDYSGKWRVFYPKGLA